jgi:predicted transglutaminase-like cysteine proteinase
MAQRKATTMQTIVMDGNLEKAEALAALSAASRAATAALPDALIKCKTQAQMQKVIADRDTCQLAFTNCQERSLRHTGPLFEQMAKELENAAKDITRKSKHLQDATEAINLLSDAVRLATSLALAFA